jgi:cytochrome P450
MQKVIEQSLGREYHLHLILFPELFPFYLTKFDRELKKNASEIRKSISAMIKERRENPDEEEATDLLSILIKDPTFSTMDEKHIIDEAITFFIAGSMT